MVTAYVTKWNTIDNNFGAEIAIGNTKNPSYCSGSWGFISGEPSEIRTPDTLIKSQQSFCLNAGERDDLSRVCHTGFAGEVYLVYLVTRCCDYGIGYVRVDF